MLLSVVERITLHVCTCTLYYISTDATLTSANLHSALASLSDHDLEDVLMGSSGGSREEMITKWLMISPLASWKWLAAFCFAREKEKAVDEVKKYLNRKLGMSMMTIIHTQSTHIKFYYCMLMNTCMNLITELLSARYLILCIAFYCMMCLYRSLAAYAGAGQYGYIIPNLIDELHIL